MASRRPESFPAAIRHAASAAGRPADRVAPGCPVRSTGAKPCSSTCTEYEPGVRNGTVNRPSASLTAVLAPCAPVTVTATPGSGRPCASTVRPASVPPVSCAAAAPAMTQPRNASTITTHRFRMTHVSVQPSSTAERALASGGKNPTRETKPSRGGRPAGFANRWIPREARNDHRARERDTVSRKRTFIVTDRRLAAQSAAGRILGRTV